MESICSKVPMTNFVVREAGILLPLPYMHTASLATSIALKVFDSQVCSQCPGCPIIDTQELMLEIIKEGIYLANPFKKLGKGSQFSTLFSLAQASVQIMLGVASSFARANGTQTCCFGLDSDDIEVANETEEASYNQTFLEEDENY